MDYNSFLVRYSYCSLTGKACSSRKIDTKNAFGKWQESWGIKSFVEEVYMLTLK